MNPSDDPLMAVFTLDQQHRFLCAIIDDPTGERLQIAKPIEADAFSDFEHRSAWRAMRRSESWDAAVLLPTSRRYNNPPQPDEIFTATWPTYLNAAKLAWAWKTGDFNRIAESIPESNISAKSAKDDELWQRIEARGLNLSEPIPRPEDRFSIAGKGICTPGNLTAIVADSGVGKSAFLGAFIAAVEVTESDKANCDTLRVTASKPTEGAVVIYIDTEQSAHDHQEVFSRALRRAKFNEGGEPRWLVTHALADLPIHDLRRGIRLLAEHYAPNIHSVILDGGADFLADINDLRESNEFVAELQSLAIEIGAPIISVIHCNPGSDFGKGRGHFGSQFDRKAESVLHLTRSGEVTKVKSKKSRRAPITDADGVAFVWSDEAMMHVTAESPAKAKAKAKRDNLRQLMEQVFAGKQSLRSTQLKELVTREKSCRNSTADTQRKAAVDGGIIGTNEIGEYVLLPKVITLMK